MDLLAISRYQSGRKLHPVMRPVTSVGGNGNRDGIVLAANV